LAKSILTAADWPVLLMGIIRSVRDGFMPIALLNMRHFFAMPDETCLRFNDGCIKKE